MGIWTALDPFEGMMDRPMSLNGYGYVHGNPVTNVDPSGMFVQALAVACITNPAACVATVAVGVGIAVGAVMAVQQFGKDITCSLHPGADFCQGDTTANELACRVIEELLQEAINPPKPYSVEDAIKQTFPHLYYPIKGVAVITNIVTSESDVQTDTDTDTKDRILLYHYTFAENVPLIIASGVLHPSLKEKGDAQHGDGQYFTDLTPVESATVTRQQHAYALFTQRMMWGAGRRNYLPKDVAWLEFMIESRKVRWVQPLFGPQFPYRSIYLHETTVDLSITDIYTGNTGIVVFEPGPSGHR
jgi:hypothetical protein